jgi:hypothetical protein
MSFIKLNVLLMDFEVGLERFQNPNFLPHLDQAIDNTKE